MARALPALARCAPAWLVGAALVVSGRAVAADPATTAAQAALSRGVDAFEGHDYPRAAREFAAAAALAPATINPRLWLARTAGARGDCAEVARHGDWVVARLEPGDERAAIIAALATRCALGLVTITVEPGPAEVAIDAAAVGPAPIVRRSLVAGRHAIEVRRAGAAPWRADVTVVAGEHLERHVVLRGGATPWTRRWYVWAAVAGVAAVAVGTAWALADDDAPASFRPIRCELGGCEVGP